MIKQKVFFAPKTILWGLLIMLFLLIFVSANLGAMNISIWHLWNLETDNTLWNIWLNIRLPRVLLAVLVGSALAVSGAIMQGIFRNPLADPGLLGMSSGAALSVSFLIVFPYTVLPPIFSIYNNMFVAFLGCLLISFIIYLFSRDEHGNLSRLLLVGIAINAICATLIGLLSYIGDDTQLRQMSLWSMGNLSRAGWPIIFIAASLILPAILLVFCLSTKLNILQLGDEEAHYLGVNTAKVKLQLLLLSSLLIGVAVSISGIIGFIGLVIPHLIRLNIGADHRWLIPGSALAGAILLLLADMLAKTLVAPTELPVGLLTSLLGAPYFLWLILQKKRG